METIRIRSVVTLLLAGLLTACANGNDEREKELAGMRTELEQLTNALGRLEFRVYQLESQQLPESAEESAVPETPSDSSANTAANPEPGKTASPQQSDKRFDLAPVE